MASGVHPFPLLISALWGLIAAAKHPNSTLLYDGSNSIRNCSCASEIQACNYALANILCSCRTIPQSTIITGNIGLTYQGGLTVWVANPWVLNVLVNQSSVQDLRLAACGSSQLSAEYLIVFGLKRLRIFNSAVGAHFPEQVLSIDAVEKSRGKSRAQLSQKLSLPFQVSFLDVALLNGMSSFKAYSVRNLPSIREFFPYLSVAASPEPADNQQCQVTFIY
ncbi:exosomal polycystin-1-interacting protein-like [Amia ocellicauda]|uniref:exosomal polycystin-1-interacting protein-like n=1 Tax=Amia ocellicauda TaxID=2972642 RepID=UPI003464D56C